MGLDGLVHSRATGNPGGVPHPVPGTKHSRDSLWPWSCLALLTDLSPAFLHGCPTDFATSAGNSGSSTRACLSSSSVSPQLPKLEAGSPGDSPPPSYFPSDLVPRGAHSSFLMFPELLPSFLPTASFCAQRWSSCLWSHNLRTNPFSPNASSGHSGPCQTWPACRPVPIITYAGHS